MKVKISAIEPNHPDSGPGMRTEVFFFGCKKNCSGCQNKWTEDMPYLEVDTFKLARKVAKLRDKNVSISGGEPLEQVEGLISLLKWLRFWNYVRYFQKTSVLLFTGWIWPEMSDLKSPLLENVLRQIDYLVIGTWMKEKAYKNMYNTCVGSSNQRAYEITNKIRRKPVITGIFVDEYGHLLTEHMYSKIQKLS